MTTACDYAGCAVGETGTCALERDPATCQHRIGNVSRPSETNEAAEEESLSADVGEIGSPVLEQPATTSSFPSSRTLGPDVLSEMMASRYVTVVGILGDPESGKTACLASLYLMLANAKLDGWSFADSWSLMAFEEIVRGAREWNAGHPPDQMTVHTELADDRRPGFLHLRLARDADGRRVDLALPDLPGEWTTALIGTARTDRFEFLKAAEAIWIVVDGRSLMDKEKRQGVISRISQLAGRLKTLCDGGMPKLIIAATHRDAEQVSESVLHRLGSELDKRDLTAVVIPVASFSDTPGISAGFGIDALINATVGTAGPPPEIWPLIGPSLSERSYLSFRRDQ